MSKFITGLINMNITAAYVIAAIYIIRLFMKRLPKKYSYMLWAFAGFRLIMPFSITSVFSLFNISFMRYTGMEYVPAYIGYHEISAVNTDINSLNAPVNNLMPYTMPMSGISSAQVITGVLFLIWLSVFSVSLAYKLILYIKTAKMVRQAVKYENNIYQCDSIPTPFVMGILKPKIYIPFRMGERELSYIICHEKYHIKRHDIIIKTAASLLVSIHWFNPLVWLAYRSMTADMEESCDEAVIRSMGEDIIQDYSTSILSFALNRRLMPYSPLSFGEGSAKRRIKNMLSYKRPKKIISVLGIVLIIVTAAICTTNSVIYSADKHILIETQDCSRAAMLMKEKLINGYMDEVIRYGGQNVVIGTPFALECEGESNSCYYYFPLLNHGVITGFISAAITPEEGITAAGIGKGLFADIDESSLERLRDGNAGIAYIIYMDKSGGIYAVSGDNKINISRTHDRDKISSDTLPADIKRTVVDITKPMNIAIPQERRFSIYERDMSEYKYYKKIADYLYNEAFKTFSPYYEILDMSIFNYSENTIGKEAEIILTFTMDHKNFDREPDIAANLKNNRDDAYYREYLQPKTMNFLLRFTVDENGTFTMYADSDPTTGIKWERAEIHDALLNMGNDEQIVGHISVRSESWLK